MLFAWIFMSCCLESYLDTCGLFVRYDLLWVLFTEFEWVPDAMWAFVPLQMHGDARLLFQKDQHYRSKVWTYPPMSIMYIDDKQYNFFILYNSVILCPVIELLVTLYSIHIFYFVPVPGIKQLKTVSFLLRLSNAASWSYPRYESVKW